VTQKVVGAWENLALTGMGGIRNKIKKAINKGIHFLGLGCMKAPPLSFGFPLYLLVTYYT
jgi:hypothetical protein